MLFIFNLKYSIIYPLDEDSPEEVWIVWEVSGLLPFHYPEFASRVMTNTSSVFPATILPLVYIEAYPERTLTVSCK